MTRARNAVARFAVTGSIGWLAPLLVAMIVLVGYLTTLAPTVTFWDAGEFIAAAHGFGIPHPPGTPLYVLVAGVWGHLFPWGRFAWRINLLSALCGAAAAGCWFVVVRDLVTRLHADIDAAAARWLAVLGGLAAALLASFSLSVWQSATEAEVYAGSMLLTALAGMAATRWRAARGDPRAERLLLTVLVLGALATADHPMGLLVGPALVAMLGVEVWHSPLADVARRRREQAQVGIVAATWLLFVGLALASPIVLGAGLALLIAILATNSRGQWAFVAMTLAIVLVAASVQVFLLLRARQHPFLDQGDPSTWHALIDVIRRTTYPPRTPFDNPVFPHGPGNPGRSPTILLYQAINYIQYFDWQWAASLGVFWRVSAPRLLVTLLMISVGIRGAFANWRRDRTSFAFVGMLFLAAGPLLLLYLNFKPGPSIGWNVWPDLGSHEVRDRDYFFVGSFIAWGIWVAVGAVDIVRAWAPRLPARRRVWLIGVFAIGVMPFALNFRAADRRTGPETFFARDFAVALLASVPPRGILFTWGDNDTFPLWYLQQVEGVRRDVTVVCLALAPADWYIHNLAHQASARLTLSEGVLPDDLVRNIVQANAGRRPIVWSTTAADALAGFAPHLVQQGLALVLPLAPVDSSRLGPRDAASPDGVPLDVPATRGLISRWWFGDLEREGDGTLDGNIQALADYVAAPMRQLGLALLDRADTVGARNLLRRAVAIAGDSLARARLAEPGLAPSAGRR